MVSLYLAFEKKQNFSIHPLLLSILNLLAILASLKPRTYKKIENAEINEDDIHLIIKNLK